MRQASNASAISPWSMQNSSGISVVLNPLATLFCQARFCAERISTSPPEHDNGPDRGKQLVRSVIKNFNYPGRAVVLRWYASGVSDRKGIQMKIIEGRVRLAVLAVIHGQ